MSVALLFLFTGCGLLSPTLFLMVKPSPQLCQLCFSFACVSITTLNSTFLMKNCRSYLEINLHLVDLDDDTYQRYSYLFRITDKLSVRIMIVICFIVLQIIISILVSVIYDEEFSTKEEIPSNTNDISDNIVHHACTYPLPVIGVSFSLLLPVITVNFIVVIKTRMLPTVSWNPDWQACSWVWKWFLW